MMMEIERMVFVMLLLRAYVESNSQLRMTYYVQTAQPISSSSTSVVTKIWDKKKGNYESQGWKTNFAAKNEILGHDTIFSKRWGWPST